MGIGRDLPDALLGLAVEWNVDAERSWAWNDNQVGAAFNDPDLLTRLLQQSLYSKASTFPTREEGDTC